VNALLVLWFATIGADRVDFLAGTGPFLLSPFLVLTPMVILLGALHLIGRGGGFAVPRNLGAYLLVVTALLAITLVSVFFSYEADVSAKRYVLLVFQVYGTALVVLVLAQLRDPRTVLVRGAYAGLLLGTILNAVQVASWQVRDQGEFLLFGGVLNATASVYGPWIPRLSAQSLDMNRGGILFLVYLVVLLRLAPPSRLRTAAIIFGTVGVFMTLSRSVLLGVLATGAVMFILDRRFTLSRRAVALGSLTIAALAILPIVSARAMAGMQGMVAPFASRFSPGEGSMNIHFELIARGVEIGTASPQTALIGVGYGNSYVVLEEFFPDNKYGNFHSLYLTFLVESGAFALLLLFVLLTYGAVAGGGYRPLIYGLVFFNIFYQLGVEPVFWFALVLAWTRFCDAGRPPVPRLEGGATERVEPPARTRLELLPSGGMSTTRSS
jgi:hypothetical protein